MWFGDFLINSLHCSNSDKFRKVPYQMYTEKKDVIWGPDRKPECWADCCAFLLFWTETELHKAMSKMNIMDGSYGKEVQLQIKKWKKEREQEQCEVLNNYFCRILTTRVIRGHSESGYKTRSLSLECLNGWVLNGSQQQVFLSHDFNILINTIWCCKQVYLNRNGDSNRYKRVFLIHRPYSS